MLIIYLRGRIKHIKGAPGDHSSYIDNALTFNELESHSPGNLKLSGKPRNQVAFHTPKSQSTSLGSFAFLGVLVTHSHL